MWEILILESPLKKEIWFEFFTFDDPINEISHKNIIQDLWLT